MFQQPEHHHIRQENMTPVFPHEAPGKILKALDMYQEYIHGPHAESLTKNKLETILEKLNDGAGDTYFEIAQFTKGSDPRLRYKIVVLDSAFKILRQMDT